MSESSSELTDLLQQLQAGNDAARVEIIRTTLSRLETLARKMLRQFPKLRSVEETPDILQNALIRLDRMLHSLVPKSSEEFFALAAQHIRRVLLDLTKHYARHKVLLLQIRSRNSPMDSVPDLTSPDLETLERWTALHSAVENLPSPVREVFDLYFYRGLKKVEIAELLGVNIQTVYRRWQTAVERLNKDLKGDLPSW